MKLAIVSVEPVVWTSLEVSLFNPQLASWCRVDLRRIYFAHHNRCFQFTVAILSFDV